MTPALLSLTLLATFGQAETSPDADKANRASLKRMVADASELELAIAVEPAAKLTLSCEPVLRWSNPIRNVDDAAVFVYVSKERPEAVATVMSYRDARKNPRRAYELLSFSQDRLDAVRSGTRLWHSEKPGVSWRAVPEAPAPAAAVPQRRRQMQRLAEKFQVSVQSDKNRYELRMLSQPLYRYQDPKGDILEGALFAFVEGTDPELILAIEARSDDSSWKFACGRLTRWEIEVRHQDKIVGEFPQMTGGRDAADEVYHISDGGPLDLAEEVPGRPDKDR